MIRIERATTPPSALVFDSPHSGATYPPDFDHAIDRIVLRRSEDAFVEDLFGQVTAVGGTMLHALFPRCYIDPNRSLADLDTGMLDGVWPHPVAPSGKVARGAGLIWRQVKNYGQIYDRRLTCAQVQARIDTCWHPYHQAIAQLIDEACARHGRVVHVNCHSMASMGDETTEDGPVPRPDFVLGDRDGTTCDALLTETVASTLRGFGYRVAVNDPYKGVELVRRYSDPGRGRHSIQIEVNRALYMDETRIMPHPGYRILKSNLASLVETLAATAPRLTASTGGGVASATNTPRGG